MAFIDVSVHHKNILYLTLIIKEYIMFNSTTLKKCFKFSRAAPHRQDVLDTIPTRN